LAVLSEVQYKPERLKLLVGSKWVDSESEESLPVMNPGTGRQISTVPFATKEEVDRAVQSSQDAFEKWRNVPLSERVQCLFRIKNVLEAHLEDLARVNTQNHGKTVVESRGDVRRMIDNVDAGISAAFTLLKGGNLDQIANGIDEETVKEPLGVFGVICPFNFPLMVPFWYLPYAVVSGCTVVVKPSEITPLPMQYTAELLEKEVKLPPGVVNVIHGAKQTVESLISHPLVKGVTFVGSTNVGRYIYKLAGEHGKRSIVQAGAKNYILVMPDADVPFTVESCNSSFFGNAGQRCLAGANLMIVSEAHRSVLEKMTERAKAIKVGYGMDESVEMGPMVSKNAKARVTSYVEKGESEGAKLILDGRKPRVPGYEEGYYLSATIFDNVEPRMTIGKEEIFGPVASVMTVSSLDEGIERINKATSFGNAASIFTSSGRNAREFRRRVQAGNIGVNVGVVAPMAYFPFGGMRDSFFGVLHGQIDSVDFFTDRKVVITRW
jgi:malonate-semialdehyde dehydrogenase (acetylating)/methylmalonate-semialdehyde dehydrogenase